MKKFLMILIIGLAFFACDDKPKTDPFEGTWIGTHTPNNQEITIKIVAANGSFTQYNEDTFVYKGTYTVSENTVTLTCTHQYENNVWVTNSAVNTGTISGKTLTFDSITFTKQ